MLSDLETFGMVAVVYVAGWFIFVNIPSKIRIHKKNLLREDLEKNKSPDTKSPIPASVKPDFYGLRAEKENPELFKKIIEQKNNLLEKGNEIPVNAAEAFYLMRNIQHHNMIVGENGTVNLNVLKDSNESVVLDDEKIEALSKRIMDFKPDGSEQNLSQRNVLPAYIKKRIQLKCGGVRWIFEDWHAEECGLPGLCFDKHGRPMLDPEVLAEEKRQKEMKANKTRSTDNQASPLIGLSKEVARIGEMVSDIRSEQALATTVDVDKNKKPNNSTHDLKKLEEKHPIPNFLDDDPEEILEVQDLLGLKDQNILDVKQKQDETTNELEMSESISNTVAYKNLDSFLEFAKNNRSFVDAIFAIVFSKDAINNIYLNKANNEIIIEKNYFVNCIQNLIDDEDKNLFNQDLLAPRSITTFDTNKINHFLVALNVDFIIRFGAGKRKILSNLLLSNLDKKEEYILGWFVKADLDNPDLEALVKHCGDIPKIEIIADSPKGIKERSSQLENIKISY